MTVCPSSYSLRPTTHHQLFSLNVSIYLQSQLVSRLQSTIPPFYTDGSIVLDALFLVLLAGVKGKGGKIFLLMMLFSVHLYT